MLKTENYQLNKPEPADPLRLADFNENADIIDAALGAVPNIATGTYTGDGTANRTINLGFTPKAIFVCSNQGATCHTSSTGATMIHGGLVLPDKALSYGGSAPIALAITDEGLQVSYYNGTTFYNCTNTNNRVYHYVALC